MKSKLNYQKVIFVVGLVTIIICICIYMLTQMNHIHSYNDDIEVYKATYKTTDKEYHFDLKSFEDNDIRYISLNDMYNMMVIMDKNAKVYMDENMDVMRCQFNDNKLDVYYAKNKIVYNNNCVEFENNDENIYVSHKNVYISVLLTEKIVLNNEKKVKFENKTAIIE
ncbi:MAG: hypothetical protein RR585_10345 [Coprobacillus sp.]